jgi:hypothetical protein
MQARPEMLVLLEMQAVMVVVVAAEVAASASA